MSNIPGYTVDDLESGLRHLRDVLSVVCEIQFDLPIGKTDDRIDSLLWIANGMAKAVYQYNETRPEGGE